MILEFDRWIYNFFNEFAGNWLLDHIAGEEEMNSLFKGGLFVALYWYFWFRSGPAQTQRRRTILSILIGTLTALTLNRTIAFLSPFRIRPMQEPSLPHHPFSIPISPNIEQWSAFPSDTATYFFALALGLAYLSRRLAVPVMLYTAVWICLPRIYLGLHYTSDIVAGAAIGIATVWAAIRNDWLQSSVAPRILAHESNTGLFYGAAFLLSFELACLFDHIRDAVRGVLHTAQTGSHQDAVRYTLLAVAGVLVIIVAAYLSIRRYRRRAEAGKQIEVQT